MRPLKSFHYLIISLLISIFISFGCDTSESTGGTLVGTWRLTSMSMTFEGVTIPVPNDEMMQQTITFNEDGTISATGVDDDGPYTDSGTWSTNGNVLTVNSQLDGTLTFEYTVSGNTLTITMDMFEEGQSFIVNMIYTRQ